MADYGSLLPHSQQLGCKMLLTSYNIIYMTPFGEPLYLALFDQYYIFSTSDKKTAMVQKHAAVRNRDLVYNM